MQDLEWAARQARAAGCPLDQIINFLTAGVVLQTRQLAASAVARACDRADGPTAIAYGGARGGGKSFWLLAQMGADDCQRVAGLKCLLLRKVGKANLEHFEDLRRRLFSRLSHRIPSPFRVWLPAIVGDLAGFGQRPSPLCHRAAQTDGGGFHHRWQRLRFTSAPASRRRDASEAKAVGRC